MHKQICSAYIVEQTLGGQPAAQSKPWSGIHAPTTTFECSSGVVVIVVVALVSGVCIRICIFIRICICICIRIRICIWIWRLYPHLRADLWCSFW